MPHLLFKRFGDVIPSFSIHAKILGLQLFRLPEKCFDASEFYLDYIKYSPRMKFI